VPGGAGLSGDESARQDFSHPLDRFHRLIPILVAVFFGQLKTTEEGEGFEVLGPILRGNRLNVGEHHMHALLQPPSRLPGPIGCTKSSSSDIFRRSVEGEAR
jgi:hypothetical protein